MKRCDAIRVEIDTNARSSDFCELCALTTEEAYWNEPFRCKACQLDHPRRVMRKVSLREFPYAIIGRYCSECADVMAVYYRRICVRCDLPFHASGRPASEMCAVCAKGNLERAEKVVVHTHCLRAHTMQRTASLTLQEWLQTLQDFNYRCAYCQQQPYEVLEHFIPLAAGGGTTASNCVPACRQCNAHKGASHPRFALRTNHLAPSPEAGERIANYLKGRKTET